MMCPYCAGAHAADRCVHKGKMTSNCTACARAIQSKTPETDLEALFSTTPVHLHHSPLDPTCPTRIAKKKADAAMALASTTTPQASTNSGTVTTNSSATLTPPSARPPTEATAPTEDNDAIMIISS